MNDENNFIRALGGRSFILCIGSGFVCSIMLWFGKMNEQTFMTIVMGTTGAYLAAAAWRNRSEIRADVDKTAIAAGTDSRSPGL